MCTACFLPNTITDYIDIKARGLCSRTEFDTSYQGKPKFKIFQVKTTVEFGRIKKKNKLKSKSFDLISFPDIKHKPNTKVRAILS